MHRAPTLQPTRSLPLLSQSTPSLRLLPLHERIPQQISHPSSHLRLQAPTWAPQPRLRPFSTAHRLLKHSKPTGAKSFRNAPNPTTRHRDGFNPSPSSRTSIPPPPPREPSNWLPRARGTRDPFPFWWALSAIAFAGSITYVAVLFLREPPENSAGAAARAEYAASVPLDVSDRYHQTASSFDEDVGFFESVSGMNRLRRKLVRAARGNVLEVAVGTGRNLGFYQWEGRERVESLTLLDQAEEMVEVSRGKVEGLRESGKMGLGERRVRFLVQSAMEPIGVVGAEGGKTAVEKAAGKVAEKLTGKTPLPEGETGFDAVVQTMGLCSTPDPVAYLRHLGTLVKKGEGRVLLLEHGRGYYGWLNRALDRWAPAHADRHGCWWNRDIGGIVAESGLEVVKMKRHHLGTTWWVELRVPDVTEAQKR